MLSLSFARFKIMVKAFQIRINAGEAFEDIANTYPALTADDVAAIRAALGL